MQMSNSSTNRPASRRTSGFTRASAFSNRTPGGGAHREHTLLGFRFKDQIERGLGRAAETHEAGTSSGYETRDDY
jgi:hypothetical protein